MFSEDHTLRWLRSGEHYYGGSYNRSGQSGKEHTMLARAHQRVVDILSQPLEFRAPPAAVERIKQYVRDEAGALGVPAPQWTFSTGHFCQGRIQMRGSERRLSSVAYRNQASGSTGNLLGLDTSLRSYSAGAEPVPFPHTAPNDACAQKVSGSENGP